jgi:hypothetical protein
MLPSILQNDKGRSVLSRLRRLSGLPAAVACLFGGTALHAQDTTSAANASPATVPLAPALSPGGYAPPQPAVPEGVGVADRKRIEYLPVGGRVGSFFLYPDAEATTGVSDNIRATNTERMSDIYLRAQAGAQIVSGFSRHRIKAGVFVAHPFYVDHPREGITQYGGSVDGTLDIDRLTQADLTVTAGRSVVDRTDFNSPVGAASPIAYDHVSARFNLAHTFNRLGIFGTGKVTSMSYRDGVTDAGAPISQRYRDVNVYDSVAEARYNLYPGFDALVHVAYNREAYTLAADDPAQPGHLDRSSTGWTVEGGGRVELTGTLYGEVRVGYLWRDYDDDRLRNAQGFSFNGNLLWNLSGLTTLRLNASRQVEEAASTTAAGNLVTTTTLGLDHEVLRNFIVSIDGGYVHLAPLGTGFSADLWTGRLSGRYLISRRFSLKAELAHADRNSLDRTRAFRANTAWLTLSLTL